MLLLLLHVRVTINFGLCVSRNSFLFLQVLFVLLEGELLGGKPTINGYGPLLLGWKLSKIIELLKIVTEKRNSWKQCGPCAIFVFCEKETTNNKCCIK